MLRSEVSVLVHLRNRYFRFDVSRSEWQGGAVDEELKFETGPSTIQAHLPATQDPLP